MNIGAISISCGLESGWVMRVALLMPWSKQMANQLESGSDQGFYLLKGRFSSPFLLMGILGLA